MNLDEHPDDSVLTRELRDSVSQLTVPERPPLAAITSRGRGRQRRRLAGFGGLAVTGAAAGIALAVGLTGASGKAPALSAGSGQVTASSGRTSTIQTVAFTLTSNGNGTDTLTLPLKQILNSTTFQQALDKHHIPALVKTGTYCWSNPAPADPHNLGVLTIEPPIKPLHPGLSPVRGRPALPSPSKLIANTKTVINPAKIPSGTELFFGYSSDDHAVFVDLIYIHSYTCGSQPPPSYGPQTSATDHEPA
jgi:hypothetical protein